MPSDEPLAQVPGEPAEIPAHKPDGPLAAVLIASGVGAFSLGVFTTLAAASTGFSDFLNLYDPVGPLAGKTIFASAIFFLAWAVVSVPLWRRDGMLRTGVIAFAVLTALGYLGTFPTFFEAFASE